MGKYLGVPSIIGRSKDEIVQAITSKVWAKAGAWKEKLLSKAGKEVLIKAVLQSIPTYAMSVFRLPDSAYNSILAIIRNFWWGHRSARKPLYWKSWDHLCRPKKFGGLGFRDLKDFNTALLAKQGWRLIHQPNLLVSKILKAKYYPYSEFMDSTVGSSPSFTWRNIHSAKYLLEREGIWRVGNGEKIGIWRHKWVSKHDGLMGPPQRHHMDLRVCDLADSVTGQWNIETIQECLGDAYTLDICSMPPIRKNACDLFCWPHTTLGYYSVKTGYARLRQSIIMGNELSDLWNHVWKCNVTPTVAHFAWRLILGIIPVRETLLMRGIDLDSSCGLCGTSSESILHCFMECHWVKTAWSIFGGLVGYEEGMEISAWLLKLTRLQCTEDFRKCIVFMWMVWKARNDFVFQEKPITPSSIGYSVTSFLASFDEVRFRQVLRRPSATVMKWLPPPPGVIKINCDASMKDSGEAGIGVVMRNCDGRVVQAMARPLIPMRSIKEGEAKALLEGLLLAKDKGLQHLLVESDAQSVIMEIASSQPSLSLHGDIIDRIKDLAKYFLSCSFFFIPRTCNQVADRLASVGAFAPQPKFWIDLAPDIIADVLVLDS